MASYSSKPVETGVSVDGTALDGRIQEAEQAYRSCLADYGHDSGEDYAAEWHLRELQRQAVCSA